VEREPGAVAVVIAGLVTLEATRINGGDSTPASLLRRSAEQAAEFTHVEFLFPPAERGMIRGAVKVEFFADSSRVVEPRFSLAEVLSSSACRRINAIWAHSANPLAPSGAAGSSDRLRAAWQDSYTAVRSGALTSYRKTASNSLQVSRRTVERTPENRIRCSVE